MVMEVETVDGREEAVGVGPWNSTPTANAAPAREVELVLLYDGWHSDRTTRRFVLPGEGRMDP